MLVAVFLVKELPVDLLRWIVVGVLVYTSATLYWSSLRPETATGSLDSEAPPSPAINPCERDDRVTSAAGGGS